ncbi:unnamed protein product [Moneuplotes crassus]|uniref:Uncharacterized protein n=1 Tax=Euplotes crassus TaxID=5936 RepID=A0AAD1UCA9_EUPCR|nr:unnamed protein product [Moneuplotes crassus]
MTSPPSEIKTVTFLELDGALESYQIKTMEEGWLGKLYSCLILILRNRIGYDHYLLSRKLLIFGMFKRNLKNLLMTTFLIFVAADKNQTKTVSSVYSDSRFTLSNYVLNSKYNSCPGIGKFIAQQMSKNCTKKGLKSSRFMPSLSEDVLVPRRCFLVAFKDQ